MSKKLVAYFSASGTTALAPDAVLGEGLAVNYSGGSGLSEDVSAWLERKQHPLLTAEGKIDYRALKPVLFEMPTYEYLRTGEVIGKCMSFGTQKKQAEGENQNV